MRRVLDQKLVLARGLMKPGELDEMEPLVLKRPGRGEHTAAKIKLVGLWEGHVRIHRQPRQAHFILLRVIGSPRHHINRTLRHHPPMYQSPKPGLEQERHLGRHS